MIRELGIYPGTTRPGSPLLPRWRKPWFGSSPIFFFQRKEFAVDLEVNWEIDDLTEIVCTVGQLG
jgi:hypothetical protein